MPSVCAGGAASQAKPGQAPLIIYGAGAIASILNNRGAFFAAVVAPLMGVIQFDLTQMCTVNPPAIPSINAAEVTEMIAFGGTLASKATRQKFVDLVTNFLWYQLCECTSGAQPTPPAAPSPPADLPDNTNQYNGTGPGLTCYSTFNNAGSSQNTGVYLMLDNPDQNGNNTVVTLPAGARNVRISASVTPDGATHTATWHTTARWFDSGGGLTNQSGATHPNDGNVYFDDFVAPTGTAVVSFGSRLVGVGTATYTDNVFLKADFYCGGAPGITQTPCCPADQFQTAMIQQILDYVKLLQRQLVPFAYVPGTVHAGLSGNGSFSIQGLLGVKIDATTIPGALGQAAGTPVEFFDAGWVTFGTADGYPQSTRFEHDPQLILPARCSAFTDFAYAFHPGVVATVTELHRES